MSFRFKIGDVVCLNTWKCMLGAAGSLTVPCMVIERIIQECHGGTQYKYLLRNGFTHELIQHVSDFELEAYDTSRGNTPYKE